MIDPYFAAAYRKFVGPSATSDHDGLYDFANDGLGRLAYAAWTNNLRLASRELSVRRRQFARTIQSDGYIRNNSFRGVRALWYHTYGLDPALSYALVARSWGMDLFRDPQVGPRLRAAVEKSALGITDYAAFRRAGNRGDSYSLDPRDEEPFVHQLALNLYTIAAREFGIRLPRSARHFELVRYEDYSQTSGLSAACYYSSR